MEERLFHHNDHADACELWRNARVAQCVAQLLDKAGAIYKPVSYYIGQLLRREAVEVCRAELTVAGTEVTVRLAAEEILVLSHHLPADVQAAIAPVISWLLRKGRSTDDC